MLKLGCPTSIGGDTCPIIGPCLVSISTQADHRLNCKARSSLGGTHGFILGIMRNVWSGVKELINAMATVGLDNAAVSTLGVLLDHVSRVSKEHAWFDYFDCLVKTFSRRLNNTDRVCICSCLVADIIGFIKVAVEAFVIECDVEVEYVTIQQNSLIWYAMADDFVW